MEGINIVDVLSEQTTVRPESIIAEPKEVNTPINSNDFDSAVERVDTITGPTEIVQHPAQQLSVNEPEEVQSIELDSAQTAEALIDMVDIVQKGLFTILGAKKLKKNIPDDLMQEFQAIDIKFTRGEELTDIEKGKYERYLSMMKRLDTLYETTPFTKEEKENLLAATEVFAKKSGIKIPPGAWFAAQMASVLSSRAINHAML